MNLSVIVPLYNEEESLPELFSWIKKVDRNRGYLQKQSGSQGYKVPPQLRQIAGFVLRFQAGARRRGGYDGCRFAGQPRRDSRLV